MDTTYGYFRLPVADTYTRGKKARNNGRGYICIRVDRPPKGSEHYTYTATLSFCSPFDQFSKKLGRQIADRRMAFVRAQAQEAVKAMPNLPVGDTRKRHISVEFVERPKMVEVFKAVLRKACSIEVKTKTGTSRPLMPRWFRSSAMVPGYDWQKIEYGLRTG